MDNGPTEKQLAALRRRLSARNYAIKAFGAGFVGVLVGLLLVFVGERMALVSDLGALVLVLGLVIGALGFFGMGIVHYISCPFCNKWFYNPFFWGSIFRDTCMSCGKGEVQEETEENEDPIK